MSAKTSAFRALRSMGAFRLVAASPWRSRRLLILCYHGLSLADEHEWNPDLYVTPEHFRQRLQALRRLGCNVLPLREALQRLHSGTLPPRAVALTFDDGTTDFATRAIPILRDFGMHATLYLTTYYSERRFPIFDTGLSYLLWKARELPVTDAPLDAETGPLRVATAGERADSWRRVRAAADDAALNGAEKDALLRRVAAHLALSYDECFADGKFYIMSPDEVRALPRDLVEISLHTHRHRTPRDRALFAREITENARSVGAILGPTSGIVDFCYPSGQYRGEFPGWLEELGVQSATTCVPGLATPASPRMLLPRLLDTTDTPDEVFEAWATGVAELFPRRAKNRLEPSRLRQGDTT